MQLIRSFGRLIASLARRLGPGIAKRLLQVPAVLFLMIAISFAMTRCAPGSPFSRNADKPPPPEVIEKLEEKYGLDRPLHVQFGCYLAGLARGDLGPSYTHVGKDVNDIIGHHLKQSLMLGAIALLLALTVGVGMGTLAALRRNRVLDHATMSLVMLGVSIPIFVVAPLLQFCFSTWLGWLPVAGTAHPLYLVLPALALAAPFAARIAGLTRAGVLEVLEQDHVRTARAKGLAPARIVALHVLRGGILPVISFLGPAVASILTGSLVVEKIFALPGLGREFIDAALSRDYTLVLGTVVVYGVLIVFFNLVADVVHAALDPRVRHG